jgi:hypothetical protein
MSSNRAQLCSLAWAEESAFCVRVRDLAERRFMDSPALSLSGLSGQVGDGGAGSVSVFAPGWCAEAGAGQVGLDEGLPVGEAAPLFDGPLVGDGDEPAAGSKGAGDGLQAVAVGVPELFAVDRDRGVESPCGPDACGWCLQ